MSTKVDSPTLRDGDLSDFEHPPESAVTHEDWAGMTAWAERMSIDGADAVEGAARVRDACLGFNAELEVFQSGRDEAPPFEFVDADDRPGEEP